jgi:hypothetical protein
MGGSTDASHNRAPDQLSFAKSLLIIGAAGALNFLMGVRIPVIADRRSD